jgi:hypothetical protein
LFSGEAEKSGHRSSLLLKSFLDSDLGFLLEFEELDLLGAEINLLD